MYMMNREIPVLSHPLLLSLGFQNCIMRLSRLALLALAFFSGSLSIGTSIDSLLRSPCELLIRRLRLARLERRRPKAVDVNDAGRGISFNGGCLACGFCAKRLSLVMVELLLVRDGISSTDIRTSGPGSPMSSDWKLSSVMDDGAVEMHCASYDIGDLGEGNAEDCVVDHGLTGPKEAAGRLSGVTSTGAKSLGRKTWRGEGVADPHSVEYGGVGSTRISSSHFEFVKSSDATPAVFNSSAPQPLIWPASAGDGRALLV
jgi:hypothetical protein